MNMWAYTRYLLRDRRGFLGLGAIGVKVISRVPGVSKVANKVVDFGGKIVSGGRGGSAGPCPGQPPDSVVREMFANIGAEDLRRLRAAHSRGHNSAWTPGDPFALAKNIYGGSDCRNPKKEVETRLVFEEMLAKYTGGVAMQARPSVGAPATGASGVRESGIGGEIRGFFGDLVDSGKRVVRGGIEGAREGVQTAAPERGRFNVAMLALPAALVVGAVLVARKVLK